MKDYHYIWLKSHPRRTEGWLRDKLKDGFHIHHIDGNHGNSAPNNLVLIEGSDHFMLHNGLINPLTLLKGKTSSKETRVRKNLWISPCRKYFLRKYKRERFEGVDLSRDFYLNRFKSVDELNTHERMYYNV